MPPSLEPRSGRNSFEVRPWNGESVHSHQAMRNRESERKTETAQDLPTGKKPGARLALKSVRPAGELDRPETRIIGRRGTADSEKKSFPANFLIYPCYIGTDAIVCINARVRRL